MTLEILEVSQEIMKLIDQMMMVQIKMSILNGLMLSVYLLWS